MNAHRNEAKRFLALFAVCLAPTALAQSPVPTITDVRTERTNCVVTVSIPPGMQRVTLETTSRFRSPSWTPRAVIRPDAKAGVLTFRLPLSRPMELIRVRADTTEPFAAAIYQGTNLFSAPTDSSALSAFDVTTGTVPGAQSGSPSADPRAVVESDIWQLSGDTLYFFNQYRGLQVIDITDPDHAQVRGTLSLPAAGDQMYLLSSNRVVLLARDGCNYDQSQVLLVADTNGPPQVTARLPVPGTLVESRLVGTALYVASQTSRPVAGTTNTVWEWGTLVSAFDLANPDAPVVRNTLWYSGYANVVAATDTYLFVVTQSPANWYQSILNLVDITDPAGTMAAYGSVTNRGRVLDKFKLNYAGGVLAAISEDSSGTGGLRLVTRLETFHLSDPRAADPLGIVKLGELELGGGEQLHATRFDGNRVYVVTFFRVDPLWVVDFSDPTAPRIAGSVTVPGWSTFIQPLGARLVTLGIETNRVSVALYDVTDPASPARLSLVTLGTHYSWSVANFDEKAFTVLPEAGLVLVPFSGDATNGYTSALQLIDYSPRALSARGQVSSASGLSYRRATLAQGRLLSLSDWELTTVDAGDRDNPVITGRLVLAESVDRLLLAGQFLVYLSAGNWWDATTPVVGVAATSAPDRVLERRTLLPLPLLGAAKHGDWLYLLQGTPTFVPAASYDAQIVLTVLSVASLPSLASVNQVFTNTTPLGWSRDWQALWPKTNLLVWAGGAEYCWCAPLNTLVGGPALIWPPIGGQRGGNGHLLAFDASRPEAPVLATQVDLTTTNRYGFSRAYAADRLLYLSHQTSEFVPDPVQTNTGKWFYRSFLDVVDFADPGDPFVREPVSIPNALVGIAQSGALLFTVGSHWNTDPSFPWYEYLDASAYDGVAAYLIDSLPLPAAWPHPTLVLDATVLLANPGDLYSTNPIPPVLQTWSLSTAGKFVQLGSAKLPAPASDLVAFPGLVAAADTASTVTLFDPADPAALRLVGSGRGPLCWWWPDLGHADGNLPDGLWIPFDAYGVVHIPTAPRLP